MEVWKITIDAPTCSFRPHYLQRVQPTFPLPPPSTIFGLLSSAAGRYVAPNETKIGYVFNSNSIATDLQKIYPQRPNGHIPFDKIGPLNRDILFESTLILYIDNDDLANAIKFPHFQLCLGRGEDLAVVKDVEKIKVEEVDDWVELTPTQIVDYNEDIDANVVSMVIGVTDTKPRFPIAIRRFMLIQNKTKANIRAIKDRDIVVQFHDFSEEN